MIRRLSSLLVVAVLAGTASTSLNAQTKTGSVATPEPGVNFVLEGGFEFGGAKLIDILFVDGSTQSLTAGQGGTIAAGLQFRPASQPRLSIAGTLGYKFVTNASENADIGITRIPVEVIARWALNDDWWAGAGIVKHSNIKIEGDGFIPDEEMESSAAPSFELGWRWVAVTYTAMTYTSSADEDFDASAIGVSVRWVPRKKK